MTLQAQEQKSIFIQGDQFLGMNVNPTNGDLVLRYYFFEGDVVDANGRGVTDSSIEYNAKACVGRPIIFAPREKQGGTQGHTDFRSTNPYDYEVARILRIERATKNLLDRIRKYSLFQTSSSQFNQSLYNQLYNAEKKLWVMDAVVTNETFKKLILDPSTSHLIPRYVSPSIIHARNPTGDYTKVNKWILDHVGIVDKPVHLNGKQVAGAAYGEKAKLRGVCYGDKMECLNILQTNSSMSKTLSKCVTCPVMLRDALTDLFVTTMQKHSYLFTKQSSSSNMSSDNGDTTTGTTQPNNQQAVKAQNALASLTNPTNNTNVMNQGQDQASTFTQPTGQGFVPDNKMLADYAEFGKTLTQWLLENKTEVRNIIDADKPLPTTEGTPQQVGTATDGTLVPAKVEGDTTPSPSIDTKALLDKLNITADQLKTMEAKDIAAKFGEVKDMLENVVKQTDRTSRELANIRKKEELQVIESIIPKETFTDQRGFNQKDYNELISYLHEVKDTKGNGLRKDIMTLIGVGLITLKNKQSEVSQQQKTLKEKATEYFGSTLKQTQAPTQQAQV